MIDACDYMHLSAFTAFLLSNILSYVTILISKFSPVEFTHTFRHSADDRYDHGYNEGFQIVEIERRLSNQSATFIR